MKITFNVQYRTQWGQQVVVLGELPELGAWNSGRGLLMDYLPEGRWQQTIQLPDEVTTLYYRYALVDDQGHLLDQEWEHQRTLDLTQYPAQELNLIDSWRPEHHPENALDNSAFQQVIFKGKKYAAPRLKRSGKTPVLTFQLHAPRLEPGQRICLSGSSPELGNWDPEKPLLLGNSAYPLWSANIPAPAAPQLEYKYGVYDTRQKKVLFLETGPNRRLLQVPTRPKEWTVLSDIFFNHPDGFWKGSGLAIPVFSLRTQKSFGVGAFSDIRLLVDWARAVGMKLVQILPINDTSATFSWTDSYPYAAISVFALHPQYLDLEALPGFKEVIDKKNYKKQQQALNGLDQVDYEAVMEGKLTMARQVFDANKEPFLKSKDFKAFFKNARHWLEPYAYFCALRDRFGTTDFNQWEADSVFSEKKLKAAAKPQSKDYEAMAFYYYLQFHLDRQLLEVAAYARQNHIVLKGDIPIGIYRYSVDAWTQPHLYNMDAQSGAPPDPFSDLGQNWGFPTYNWSEMAKNGYQWWQNRLRTLSRYFDAFRIDHILGFFRIWQIPYEQIQGTLGYFNPAIPVTRQELRDRGIDFDPDRFCKPYITAELLQDLFDEDATAVTATFLEPTAPGRYQFKEEFDTQRKISEYLDLPGNGDKASWKSGLYSLHTNVLFIVEMRSGEAVFHPRIDWQTTYSFRQLAEPLQQRLNTLYQDYFYHRQEEFWREQAMTKLPAIKKATNMLICGEDLGMIPACVPEVMRDLDLLTLEIQRMSKNPKTEFVQPADVPYFSVCSPSTHDMSPIRAWWEESDPDQIRRFYHQQLQFRGQPPASCETYVAEKIILKHLQLPSMWAVFPIQDLLGMDSQLRHPDPMAERINIPANPQHYWRYRLHFNLETLISAEGFNQHLRELLEDTVRS